MLPGPDLLEQDAPGRARLLGLVAAGLLLAIAAGAAAVRSSLPPTPLTVQLSSLDGSALVGESFVRLQVQLQSTGAQGLGDARLTVAGATGRGLHRPGFDDQGRLTVQVDVTPDCATVAAGVPPGTLDLRVRDEDGGRRLVQLDVPTEGRLERLVRYRCRSA